MEEILFCGGEWCTELEVGACPGHVNRKFLQECTEACTCPRSCGNRVVQNGSHIPIQVFWSGEKEWGLRSKKFISKGSFVFEYVGEIVTDAELQHRRALARLGQSEAYTMALNASWNQMEDYPGNVGFCIDATNFSNVTRFLNHRYFFPTSKCMRMFLQ